MKCEHNGFSILLIKRHIYGWSKQRRINSKRTDFKASFLSFKFFSSAQHWSGKAWFYFNFFIDWIFKSQFESRLEKSKSRKLSKTASYHKIILYIKYKKNFKERSLKLWSIWSEFGKLCPKIRPLFLNRLYLFEILAILFYAFLFYLGLDIAINFVKDPQQKIDNRDEVLLMSCCERPQPRQSRKCFRKKPSNWQTEIISQFSRIDTKKVQ